LVCTWENSPSHTSPSGTDVLVSPPPTKQDSFLFKAVKNSEIGT
jgi:hypothetical protein